LLQPQAEKKVWEELFPEEGAEELCMGNSWVSFENSLAVKLMAPW
jgi:hypothetical protein